MPDSQQPRFYHNVYFWLAENASADATEKLAAGAKRWLSDIPGVEHIAVGVPAETNRPVIDRSYAVALLTQFTDAAAQDAYQVHPDHLQFVAECKQYWSKVVIYDSVE